MKFLFWPPFIIFALWWLAKGGLPEPGRNQKPYPKPTVNLAFGLAVVLFGFTLGAGPNPMQAVVDFFLAIPSSRAIIAQKGLSLIFFSILAVIGTKLICGWGCPFGTLQELLYEIPIFRRIKSFQFPFLITAGVRTLVFMAFLVVLFGWTGGSIYEPADPFRLFDSHFDQPKTLAAAAIFLFLSLFSYRPFCQVVCPFGWYSWFLERISLFGIRLNRRRCTRCFGCAHACPLEAARGRLEGWSFPADCFSCARCLRVCPAAAIDYGPRWRRPG